MKRRWLFLIPALVALGLGLLIGGCDRRPDAYDSAGRPIRLADFSGRWVVVNYWADWCLPCLQELPELDALGRAYRDRVVVLGVNFDGWDNQKLQAFARQHVLTFPLLSTLSLQKWGIHDLGTLPVTFLISPVGTLADTLYGPQTRATLLKAMDLT